MEIVEAGTSSATHRIESHAQGVTRFYSSIYSSSNDDYRVGYTCVMVRPDCEHAVVRLVPRSRLRLLYPEHVDGGGTRLIPEPVREPCAPDRPRRRREISFVDLPPSGCGSTALMEEAVDTGERRSCGLRSRSTRRRRETTTQGGARKSATDIMVGGGLINSPETTLRHHVCD